MNLGFGNNIKSALASDITATQTTITVMPGTGALFALTLQVDLTVANIAYSETLYSKLTLTDAQETIFEICHLLSVNGDNLTIIRAQEGTTAKGWSLNDVVSNFATRGSENTFVQIEDLHRGKYLSAPAGGTENALTVELPSTFFINGANTFSLRCPLTIFPIKKNTGPCTLQLTMSGMVVGTFPIFKGHGSQLTAGDINPSVPFIAIFCPSIGCFQITNPGTGLYDLAGYLPLTGGTLSGNLTVNASTRTQRLAVGSAPTGVFATGAGINIGDSDTGFMAGGDGVIYIYANGANAGYISPGGLAYAGTMTSLTGTLATQAPNAGANCHLWFYDQTGAERAVIWSDSQSVLYLRSKNGSSVSIPQSGDVRSGSSFYESNGARVYSPNNPPPMPAQGMLDMRLSGPTAFTSGSGTFNFPNGCVLTGLGDFGADNGYGTYAALQKNINGVWVTIAGPY